MKKPHDANVSLHIERMVLEGFTFSRAELGRLQSSMERELTSLLRARGVPGGGRAEGLRTARVRGLSPDRPGGPPQTPAQVGRELARSVYECLAPGL